MNIKNIIFDFGGVLIDWNPEYLYQDVFQDKKEMTYFLKNICNTEWNLRQDAGRTFGQATQELIRQYPRYQKEIKLFESNWLEMIGGEIEQNTALIKDLKSNFRLFGLTNWSAETFPLVYDQYPFFSEFEGIVVSGQEKIAKPDASIYTLLLNRYSLKAIESIFIDDNLDNIKTAKQLGFKTIHLNSETNLKDELQKNDIKTTHNKC